MDIPFPSFYINEKTKVARLADWLRLAQLVSGAGSRKPSSSASVHNNLCTHPRWKEFKSSFLGAKDE